VGIFITCPLFGDLTVSVLRSTTDNLTIEFILPEYQILSREGYSYIECPELKREEIEGRIDLPYYSFLIGVPTNGNVHSTIILKEDSFFDLTAPVAPFPKFIKESQDETYTHVYEIKQDVYLPETSKELLEISEPYLWRQQTVVMVIIRPFTVHNNRLKIVDKLKLSFSLTGNKAANPFTDKNFEKIFKNTIINFDISKHWSSEKRVQKQDNPFSHADRWFKIPITESGICKLTKQELSQAGIDVENLDPNEIKVFNGGGYSQDRDIFNSLYPFEEVPVFVSANGSDFTVYFYVRGTNGFQLNQDYNQYFNPYTGENIYWLTYNYNTDITSHNNSQNKSTRDQTKRETLTTYRYSEHFEKEKVRSEPDGIVWYWQSFIGSGAKTKNFDFSVSELNTNEPQELIINFNINPYSSITTYVNGILLTKYTSRGSHITYTGNFFQNGKNTLKIVQSASSSQALYFDYYEISYTKNLKMENNYLEFSLPQDSLEYTVNVTNVSNNELQIFQIRKFDQASKITNYNYASNTLSFEATSDTAGTKFCIVSNGGYIIPDVIEEKFKPLVYLNGAEIRSYLRDEVTLANTEAIIITPAQFWEKSKELADVHIQYDGLNVMVVNIDDIYDEFSWGLTDVVAVRYFLKYGFDYYAIIPERKLSYVVLAGDGTNDFRGYEPGSEEKNKILPFLKVTTVSDDKFVYFTNTNPSLMIGRFPGYTSSQMEIMIDKTIDYITQPNYGYWRNRVILCADDFLKDGRHKETVNTYNAELCARFIEDNVELVEVYGIRYPLDEFKKRPEANKDLIKKINEGAAVFYYIGHGGYDVMGDEDYFRASRDIGKLNNGDMLNFFIAASCNIGYFDSNTIECTVERFLYTKNRGAVAAFAATRGGGYGPCTRIVDYIVNGASERIRIGEAVIISKGGSVPKSYESYLLFGDPMLRSALPAIRGNITIAQELADSLQARQTAELRGIIDTTGCQLDEVFIVVYDTDYDKVYEYEEKIENVWVTKDTTFIEKGKAIFKGPVSTQDYDFDFGFIVPDDIYGGQLGHILSYSESSSEEVDVAMRYNKRDDIKNHDLIINGYAESENDGPPQITMWMDNDAFKSGDYVSSSPLVYIEILDSNGVNITNYPGHRILLTVDNEDEYNITEYFVYDLDSYIKGSIEYQLESIPAGIHTLRLEVFDNLNEVAFEEVEFKIKSPDNIDVRTVLNYPNPMDDHTYFTFYLDGDASVDIEIFTIAGRKIKIIDNQILHAGYNQVLWNGKDEDGDVPSNGVYFYKLIVNGKRIDDVFKIIIFH